MSLPNSPSIGAAVIDRGWKFYQAALNYVVIEGSNPINFSGTITTVGVYIEQTNPANTVNVGIFDKVGANDFTLRSSSGLKAVSVGYNTLSVSLTAVSGDYIGLYLPATVGVEEENTGGTGIWYVQRDNINLSATTCTWLANAIISVGGIGARVYPTDPTTRVTSIIHRYDRGVYNTELLFGDVISDFSIPNVDSTTTKAYQNKEELDKINNALPQNIPVPTPTTPVQPTPAPTVATPTSQSPTGIVELTDYAKAILATPAGQAAVARQQGLAQGVEAVVTPYAIDVLKRNEEEAKLLTQIQKMTTAAKATGITSYARGVLLKAIVDAKARLKELYKQ